MTTHDLHDLYYNPNNKTAFARPEVFFKEAQKIDPSLKRSDVDEWLRAQLPYTLHKQARKNYPRAKILVSKPNELCQADLVDVHNLASCNNKFKFLLTFIDAFSKMAFVEPLLNKSGEVVAAALHKILIQHGTSKLQTDQGKEFLNKHVKKVLKDHHVFFFTSHNKNIKCSIVERFNKTLKIKLYKHFTGNETKNYVSVLQKFVSHYNNSEHRTIGMQPNQVNEQNSPQVFKRIYGFDTVRDYLKQKQVQKYEVGDHVRIQYDKSVFDRGYEIQWSDSVYQIVSINNRGRPMYTLKNYGGKILNKRMYAEEIQKVTPEKFRVEKVIRYKKVNGKRLALVKWVGYEQEHNSWIEASEIE